MFIFSKRKYDYSIQGYVIRLILCTHFFYPQPILYTIMLTDLSSLRKIIIRHIFYTTNFYPKYFLYKNELFVRFFVSKFIYEIFSIRKYVIR